MRWEKHPGWRTELGGHPQPSWGGRSRNDTGWTTGRKWEDGSLGREAWGKSGADKPPTSTFMVL